MKMKTFTGVKQRGWEIHTNESEQVGRHFVGLTFTG